MTTAAAAAVAGATMTVATAAGVTTAVTTVMAMTIVSTGALVMMLTVPENKHQDLSHNKQKKC